jgi:hypothetical protein
MRGRSTAATAANTILAHAPNLRHYYQAYGLSLMYRVDNHKTDILPRLPFLESILQPVTRTVSFPAHCATVYYTAACELLELSKRRLPYRLYLSLSLYPCPIMGLPRFKSKFYQLSIDNGGHSPTYGSAYGTNKRRENGSLTNTPHGMEFVQHVGLLTFRR